MAVMPMELEAAREVSRWSRSGSERPKIDYRQFWLGAADPAQSNPADPVRAASTSISRSRSSRRNALVQAF